MTRAATHPCPRCGGAFEPFSEGNPAYTSYAAWEACGTCRAILVERPMLVRLLDQLARELGDMVAPDGPIPAVPNSQSPGACPRCARPMETFGYLEMRTVTLDRCARCAVILVDQEELPTLVVMHARTAHRASAASTELAGLADRLMRVVVKRYGT